MRPRAPWDTWRVGRSAGIDVDQIVAAAEQLANAGGLDAVTLAGVASALGVKSPSLYNHIDGRDHLITLLTRRGAAEMRQRLRVALSQGPRAEAANRADCDLAELGRAYRRFAIERPGLYAASQLGASPDADIETAESQAEVVSLVAAVLEHMGVGTADTVDVVRFIRAGLHGFVTLERDGGFGLADDVDASFEAALDMIVIAVERRVG